jgi:hypothetical protein
VEEREYSAICQVLAVYSPLTKDKEDRLIVRFHYGLSYNPRNAWDHFALSDEDPVILDPVYDLFEGSAIDPVKVNIRPGLTLWHGRPIILRSGKLADSHEEEDVMYSCNDSGPVCQAIEHLWELTGSTSTFMNNSLVVHYRNWNSSTKRHQEDK